jgi:hypothetical protein
MHEVYNYLETILFLKKYKSRFSPFQATRLSFHPCKTRDFPPHVPVVVFLSIKYYIFSSENVKFNLFLENCKLRKII